MKRLKSFAAALLTGAALLAIGFGSVASAGAPTRNFDVVVARTGATRSLSAGAAQFAVTSTLDGKHVLPHRLPWVAHPSLPAAKVKEVDFQVDGKTLWVERHVPYVYGDDGNYLVTSFLSPGSHRFLVKAISTDGSIATDSNTATVVATAAPPAALQGTWTSYRPKGGVPAGSWQLIINRVGWRILDTAGGGNLLDVAYLAGDRAEVRTGIATGHPGQDRNGWCNGTPGKPVRFHWTVTSTGLSFTSAGGHGCPGFVPFLEQDSWTKVH